MFSSVVKVRRGFCTCCNKPKEEVGQLFVLDVRETEQTGFQGKWEPKLVEADCDNAACLKCWLFIGRYISSRIRVQEYV